jgi:hypothetical protein
VPTSGNVDPVAAAHAGQRARDEMPVPAIKPASAGANPPASDRIRDASSPA